MGTGTNNATRLPLRQNIQISSRWAAIMPRRYHRERIMESHPQLGGTHLAIMSLLNDYQLKESSCTCAALPWNLSQTSTASFQGSDFEKARKHERGPVVQPGGHLRRCRRWALLECAWYYVSVHLVYIRRSMIALSLVISN